MKPSLWAQYKMERENKHVLETEYGFVVYYYVNDSVYLEDIYVLPQFRKTRVASELADKVAIIAKESECKSMIGSVATWDKNATKNIEILIKYGMKFNSSNENMLYFTKEI